MVPGVHSALKGASFGISYGGNSQLDIRQFRVLSNVPSQNGTYDITGLLHDPNKFQRIEENVYIEPNPTSNFPSNKFLTPPRHINFLELYI